MIEKKCSEAKVPPFSELELAARDLSYLEHMESKGMKVDPARMMRAEKRLLEAKRQRLQSGSQGSSPSEYRA